jgi:hypothetical protein
VKRDVVDAIESLLAHRTEDLGCYEFVLEAWMEEAASEIKRLRHVTKPLPKEKRAEHSLRLTDKERRVLRDLRDSYAAEDDATCNEIAEVLEGLLERTRPDA